MLKFLATLLIVVNPLVSILADRINQSQGASQKEAPLINTDKNNRFPLQADAFLPALNLFNVPQRNWNVVDPSVPAKIVLVYDTEHNQILFQKNGISEKHPIASMTKLMTALIVISKADLNENFKISPQAIGTSGVAGKLIVGEELSVKSLLYALLVQSSNDAAVALAENIGVKLNFSQTATSSDFGENEKFFVDLMNKKAKTLGLRNTFFVDPDGLDAGNYSSAWDINLLLQETLKYPVLQEIMQTKTIDIKSIDGRFDHRLISTDKLLRDIPEIIGGKTGYTEEAGNCMALAVRSPNNQGKIIIVVMEAADRIAETKLLFEWTKKAYLW